MTRRILVVVGLCLCVAWPAWPQTELRPASVSVATARITPGSGTGVTVNELGTVRHLVYKVTVASTQFIANATTADITIATLPAKTRVVGIYAEVATTFACTATCTSGTLSMTLGTSAGANDVLVSFDVDAAAAMFGGLDNQLGSLTNASGRIQGVYLAAWGTTQILTARLTSGTGAVGTGTATNLSKGSVTFYLVTEVLP